MVIKKSTILVGILILFSMPFISSISWNTEGQFSSGNLTTFLELTDTPADYSGQGGKCVGVTGGEDGLEFVACGSGTGNYSWNESYADTLYADIKWNYNQTSSGNDNSSWNESYATTLYADIKWSYNQTYTGGTYNSTYDKWAYNMTSSSGGNYSWNESYANDLYVNVDGDNMTGNLNSSANITANDFFIPAMDGNDNYKSLNDAFNLFNSAGRISGGEIVDAGGTSVIVTAGEGLARIADDDISQVKFIGWANSSTIDIPTDSIMYLGIDYNGGSPIVINSSTEDNWFDLDTQFPLGTVINQKDELYILNNPWWISDGLTNVIERFQAEGWLKRDENRGGLILGVTGTRNPTLTAGTLWSRLTEHEIPAFDSSGTDTFDTYYRDGAGGYNEIADQSQYSVTYYDTGNGSLTELNNNHYAVYWVWVNVASEELSLIYPQNQYSNAANAEAELVPSTFPSMWYKGGVIVGRIIIKQGTDAPIAVESAFTQAFTSAVATDHGNLAGLTDDDHKQYLLTNGSRIGTGNLSILGIFKGRFNWTTIGGWLGFDGATLSFNETKINETISSEGVRIGFNSTYNSTYDKWSYNQTYTGGTFNQTYQDYSYNMSEGILTNSSWNQSFADTIYSAIKWGYNQTVGTFNQYGKWWYNMTDGSYNSTYQNYAYNQTYTGGTYNSTYDKWAYNMTTDSGGNYSWNETRANELYADIQWAYNQTVGTFNQYGKWWYNMTDGYLSEFDYNFTGTGIYYYNQSEWIVEEYGKWFYNMTSSSGGNSTWSESYADDLYVNVEGDTMTGNLTIERNLISNSGVMTIWVD